MFSLCVHVLGHSSAKVICQVPHQSPLHVAAQRGLDSVVGLLIRRGSAKGARDQNGYTPLHLASYNGRESVVKVLVELGVDVDDAGLPGGDG